VSVYRYTGDTLQSKIMALLIFNIYKIMDDIYTKKNIFSLRTNERKKSITITALIKNELIDKKSVCIQIYMWHSSEEDYSIINIMYLIFNIYKIIDEICTK
jgi:hypothetical protein